ncbi:uncharacterized protein BT62DRAFT_1046657 [Guyanagaster necrorhizus]|uniref:Uncharacterized protein n=1 Tax=Guyanagaster necrorhizus TaxID=856835 RepID=A0A9P8ANN9_9AGAR|nr:uncharacterized protein BT62DRAFT_1046657 [Guyanagaster necrorhizus MCA 3950]KAG7441052.1 hypothetical protein BT62DRAFT_1046657 [Guyanagaster necrorhizus MCA 3950]
MESDARPDDGEEYQGTQLLRDFVTLIQLYREGPSYAESETLKDPHHSNAKLGAFFEEELELLSTWNQTLGQQVTVRNDGLGSTTYTAFTVLKSADLVNGNRRWSMCAGAAKFFAWESRLRPAREVARVVQQTISVAIYVVNIQHYTFGFGGLSVSLTVSDCDSNSSCGEPSPSSPQSGNFLELPSTRAFTGRRMSDSFAGIPISSVEFLNDLRRRPSAPSLNSRYEQQISHSARKMSL